MESGFIRFPHGNYEADYVANITKRRQVAWVAAVRKRDLTFDNIPMSAKVCSLHFHTGEFIMIRGGRSTLILSNGRSTRV